MTTGGEIRRWGRPVFLIVAFLLAASFLWYSYELTKDLARQEEERMELWADAIHELASPNPNALAFPLQVIERNQSIPVILTDDKGTLLNHRNMGDESDPDFDYKVELLRLNGNCIDIQFNKDEVQHIYYEDSTLLKKLTRYPWIELGILFAFLLVAYVGLNASKNAEQNRVWVGLSKETAHQLGTPITSLIGWLEYLKTTGTDPRAIEEMTRDVNRLTDVSARFSKIGSRPTLAVSSVKKAVASAVEYMRKRVSARINISFSCGRGEFLGNISEPLIQWVIENLIKNAADATDGEGRITVQLKKSPGNIIILVSDTGKGIPRKKWKKVFKAGFTTKSRGWGLGLTLAKRIIENYHGGFIEVVDSEPGKGTTFRIILPEAKPVTEQK